MRYLEHRALPPSAVATAARCRYMKHGWRGARGNGGSSRGTLSYEQRTSPLPALLLPDLSINAP